MFHDTVYGWRTDDKHRLSDDNLNEIEEQVAEAREVFEEEFGEKKTTVEVRVTDGVQVEIFHTKDVRRDSDGTVVVDREIVCQHPNNWYVAEEIHIGPNDVTLESEWETIPRE